MYGHNLQYVAVLGFAQAKIEGKLLPIMKETDDVPAKQRTGLGRRQTGEWVEFVYDYIMKSADLPEAAKEQIRGRPHARIRNFWNRQKAKWTAYKKIFQRSG